MKWIILALLVIGAVEGSPVVTTIMEDERLSETKKWALSSHILDNLDLGNYGFEVSLVLPSNEAIIKFREQHPEWEEKVSTQKRNIETLLLFASTDTSLKVEDIKNMKYEGEESIVSLLSQYANIQSDGKLCVHDFSRTSPCSDDMPCCGNLDLENVIPVDEGTIFIIDRVLLPQEIIDELE